MKSNTRKLFAFVGVMALAAANLQAVNFTVSNTTDSGPGSLRQAILDANAGGGGDITFPGVTGMITLGSPLPLMTANMNILGPGTNQLTVSGSNKFAIFAMSAGTTNVLSNLTIADAFGQRVY